ncbi:VOC family protein [uncultured Sphingomonas sp.]|uniref:SMU1112c/YaeR family gloxylase I-like metalloprotein n=1 Tax=uncultured Sphingomonas sp. TaxID=158754 RepID=UPI0025DDD70A|nr:VOC family protein [uncultured Sphingomonas sp.]
MSGLTGLHHVAIIASDYDRSKAFYVDVLGFTILREVWRAERRSWKCDLTLPGAQIELFTFPGAPARPSRPEAMGLRHLAFTVDDIDAEVTRLTRHGIACEPVRVDEHTGQRFTFFADPDDLPLELYETRRA